jgi:diguanylate cyclase
MTKQEPVSRARMSDRVFWVNLGITAAVLILCMLALITQDYYARRAEMVTDARARAGVIGESVSAALSFASRSDAEAILAVLRADPDVLEAAAYRGDKLFASYRRDKDSGTLSLPLAAPPPGERMTGDRLEVVEPVILNGNELGRVMIVTGIGRLLRSLIRYGIAAVVLFTLAIGGAYLLLTRTRRSVRAAEANLDYLAHFDALTGLLNRNGFLAALDAAVRRAGRSGAKLALLFVDLDDFKLVNDTLGHEAGDRLLRAVASRLTGRLRTSDIIARLGGDEFTVMIESLPDADQARRVAQIIVHELSSPFDIEGRLVYVGASVGISLYPDDATIAPDMLRNADTAMYRAKTKGKKNFAFFTPEMTAEQQTRFDIENGLRDALRNGGFHLAYQPQVTLDEGAIFGAEALLRWDDPRFGILGPAVYLKVAESSDLIEKIGDWVLHEACAQNKRWQSEGLPFVVVAVNVSTRQLRRTGFVERVRAALDDTGLEAGYLELEVTEGALMEEPEKATECLMGLREMGVHLAIDDFGTGYSSMSYLQRLPIEKLKIDKAFVRNMTRSPADASITQAIVAMGSSLKLLTLAEGVETEEVAARLREIGCWAAQGYYFGRPGSAKDFAGLLRQSPLVSGATAARLANASRDTDVIA